MTQHATIKGHSAYPLETLLVGIAILLTAAGFWNIYFGSEPGASAFHHLHILTNFIWLFLLLVQLALAGNANYQRHRRVGLSILVIAPLLVASTTLLSVESAKDGLASGQGDFMIVQNVMGTLQLALIIFLAFSLRRNRKLHASLLVSTALLFIGIATFFSLISLVPGFKIEGPETLYRFGKALDTIQYGCIPIGLIFFVRDPRNGWPFLLVGSSFLINELIKSFLTRHELIQPLTVAVGSINPTAAFFGAFMTLAVLLAATGILGTPGKGSA
jgi:hypothetical protein